jgi:HSF-type DNA-binding
MGIAGDEIKTATVDDDSVSVKKAAAAAAASSAAATTADVLLVDGHDMIEGSEELQLSFPERLMSLLQNSDNENSGSTVVVDVTRAMRWMPGGDAFLIVPSIFYDVVLDGHFHGTKFESFTRKLNRW